MLWSRQPLGQRRKRGGWLVSNLLVLLVSTVLWAGHLHAETRKLVLVLYENGRLLPANIEADRGLNQAIASTGSAVDFNSEFLDYPRFGGDAYFRSFTTYLREKYASSPPDVIVVGGNKALDFILQNRLQFFPNVPVVHMGVDKQFTDTLKLPPDVIGVPARDDNVGTIEQALRWHPRATRLIVVTGAAAPDRESEALLHQDLASFEGRLRSIEFLAGLSTDEVKRRVRQLGADDVVFTPGYYIDGVGRNFVPRESARAIAAASSAPVYGPYNTFIGTGIVGGRVVNYEAVGRVAGEIVNRLLAGETRETLQLPDVMPSTLSVDWRQIKRWGIAESDIPRDADVQFRSPGFWDLYRIPALVTAAAFALQSGLVGSLLLERRRRRRAETAVDKQRFELAHASRLAVAGELTASIAHEINQPIGAILSNVAAAKLVIDSGQPQPDELRQILEDIRRDNVRASEVIRRLRTLLEKHEVEREPLELNNSLSDMQTILNAEARRRRVDLSVRPSPSNVMVLGDKIQIQQILINLVLNAMDAVADAPEGRRAVTVSVDKADSAASIEVRDNGHGIDPDHRSKLFDSFFSTKPHGIGIGLSIVRTLVEAHGGKVRAENQSSGGAVFRVDLPARAKELSSEAA